jgi:hypothetical protein
MSQKPIYRKSGNMPASAKPDSRKRVLKRITLGADGYLPFGGLKFDSSGNLYGTNFFGATLNGSCPAGCGTVFQLTPSGPSWTFKTLHSFSGGPSDVGHSYAHVTFDSAGNLYGTGSNGGANSNCYTGTCGGVFKLTKSSAWAESVVYSFAKNTGLVPYTGLTLYKGNFYGATQFGPSTKATAGHGEIYKLRSEKGGKWSHSMLYEFTGASDGMSRRPIWSSIRRATCIDPLCIAVAGRGPYSN